MQVVPTGDYVGAIDDLADGARVTALESGGTISTTVVSVKQSPYNAIGDGVADDTAAIQAAITAALAAGLPVWFPRGTYLTSGYLLIDGASGFRVLGEAGARIRYQSDNTGIVANAITLLDNHARSALFLRHCTNVAIDGLTFEGGTDPRITSYNTGGAIGARNCTGLVVTRCTAVHGYSLFQQDQVGNTTSTGDSVSDADPSGIVTLTDASALFSPGDVGHRVTIAGATNNRNNGSFLITHYTSPTVIKFANSDGLGESSAFVWEIDNADGGTRIVDCRAESCRGPMYTGNNAVISNCEINRPMLVDACGIGDSFALSGSIVTLTDQAARFLPSHHNKVIKIAGATTGGNNGLFRVTYLSSTQVSYTNASGATENFVGTWWIANGDKAGLGGGTGAIAISGNITTLTVDTASFTASDVHKCIRIAIVGDNLNHGVFPIQSYISPTQVTYYNPGANEDFAGVWTIDGFDRATDPLTNETIGSAHGIYVFAGRSNILIDGCTFRGLRTTCVKASGSALPVRDIRVTNCASYECAEFFDGGADDNQEHTNLVVDNNMIVDCATGSHGRTAGDAIGILGASGVRVTNNHFHYTRNNIGTVDGSGIAGSYAINASGSIQGGSQALEDLAIESNRFTFDAANADDDHLVTYTVGLANVGVRGKWGTDGVNGHVATLTKSGSTMTLTDSGAQFTLQDVNKPITIVNATNGGNNGNFVVASVPTPTSLTFVNAGGTGGGVSAGTWRLRMGYNGDFSQSYSGNCRIARNSFAISQIAVFSTGCVGLEISDNTFVNAGIYLTGDCAPRIVGNRQLAAATQSAQIRINPGTSWPIIYDNFITNTNIGSTYGFDFSVGDATGDVQDWPLLGKRGRAVPTQAKQEIVIAYGYNHVDGDSISVGGTTFTYKATSPSASQFNSFTDLVSKIDAIAGVTCADYGAPFDGGIVTQHLKIAAESAGAVDDVISVAADSLFPTALVLLRNGGSGHSFCHGRGAGSAGPTADKTVIWSPLCTYSGGGQIWANNANAMTLLQAGGWRTVKNYLDAGCNEIVQHGTSAGTEEFRWVLTG